MTSDYDTAVFAAYAMRRKFDTSGLWFDVFLPISVLPRLSVCQYTSFCNLFHLSWDEFLEMIPSKDGFSFLRGDEYLIVYNSSLDIPRTRQRFTIAHELGHYILSHTGRTEAEEREADCFARNLLAPRQMAIYHGIDFADYQTVFGISAAAARVCMDKREEDERLSAGLYPFNY